MSKRRTSHGWTFLCVFSICLLCAGCKNSSSPSLHITGKTSNMERGTVKLIHSFALPVAEEYPLVAISSDHKFLACGMHKWPRNAKTSSTSTITVWDISTGKRKGQFLIPYDLRDLAFLPNKHSLFFSACLFEHELHGWEINLNSNTIKKVISSNLNAFNGSVAFSPDGELAAIGNSIAPEVGGQRVELYRTRSWTKINSLKGFLFGHITALSFSKDNQFIAGETFGGDAGETSLAVWNLKTGKLVVHLEETKEDCSIEFNCLLGFLPNDKTLVYGSKFMSLDDAHPKFVPITALDVKGILQGPRPGTLLIVEDKSNRVSLWNIAERKIEKYWGGLPKEANRWTTRDGNHLWAVTSDFKIQSWRLE